MTAAHEATLCAELKLPYALICIVDNIAHGLVVKEEDLSMKKFEEGLAKNAQQLERVLGIVMHQFARVMN